MISYFDGCNTCTCGGLFSICTQQFCGPNTVLPESYCAECTTGFELSGTVCVESVPTTAEPTTQEPTTMKPTTKQFTKEPTTADPTTQDPTTQEPTHDPTIKQACPDETFHNDDGVCENCSNLHAECADCVCPEFDLIVEQSCKAACITIMETRTPTEKPTTDPPTEKPTEKPTTQNPTEPPTQEPIMVTCPHNTFDVGEGCKSCDDRSEQCALCVCSDYNPTVEYNCKRACVWGVAVGKGVIEIRTLSPAAEAPGSETTESDGP